MPAIQNHKALWRKKRQCCDAKDVKRKPKTASHVKIAESTFSVDETVKPIPVLCSKVYREPLRENQLSNSKTAWETSSQERKKDSCSRVLEEMRDKPSNASFS